MTNANGEFQYQGGESVTFSIGDLVFPTVAAMETVTPLDMSEAGNINDNVVVNTTTLLQTLDVDANPANGIEISEQAAASASAIDMTADPSDFSQDSAVLNLVANSGSSNTSLVSAEDASRHFQLTLVEIDALESLTPLDYTNILIGNTATYEGGSSFYYQPDGARFGQVDGEIIETTWELDSSGAMCEVTTRGDTFCIADATGLILTTEPSSNVYNYSDTEFASTFTVTPGDSLGLSGDTNISQDEIILDLRNSTWLESNETGCDGSVNTVRLEYSQTGMGAFTSRAEDRGQGCVRNDNVFNEVTFSDLNQTSAFILSCGGDGLCTFDELNREVLVPVGDPRNDCTQNGTPVSVNHRVSHVVGSNSITSFNCDPDDADVYVKQ